MVKPRWCVALALAAGVSACGEETTSVGDLRCVGESIHCDLKEQHGQSRLELPIERTPDTGGFAVDAGAPEVLPEAEAAIAWTVELSCAAEHCTGGPRFVLEDDGSLLYASEVKGAVEPSSGGHSKVGGIWIARYGADGTLLAESDALVERDLETDGPGLYVPPGLSAAGKTSWGTLLVDFDHEGRPSNVYLIDDDAKPSLLFDVGRFHVDSVASAGDDLLVAGTYSQRRGGGSAMYPEVARYDRDGALVWRQTALQGGDPGAASALSNLPMVVGTDGQIFLVALDQTWSDGAKYRRRLFAVADDGNLSWVGPLFHDPDEPKAHLALISTGDVVVAHDWYILDLFHPVGDPPEQLEQRSVSRYREEFWDLVVLGFDVDAEDRLLVVTQEGARDAPRFIIDRYSGDLSERQTFVLPDDAALPSTSENTRWASEILGMRVGREGEIYLWTQAHIIRVELP